MARISASALEAPNTGASSTETPQVTNAYRQAYKSYVLVSGLLASWELIGITLDTKEKWGIELKSPKAVPLILTILVIYSGYKTTIEWLQCDKERRTNQAALLDYRIAHGIAFGAIAISTIQRMAKIQIVDLFVRSEAFSMYVGIVITTVVAILCVWVYKTPLIKVIAAVLGLMAIGRVGYSVISASAYWPLILIVGIATGVGVVLLIINFARVIGMKLS